MERMRRRNHPEESPNQVASPPAAAESGGVQMIWGSTIETLELAGMSVGEAFGMLQAPFNIAPTVAALVNGDPVGSEHRLRAGDELEFTRPAGEKGAA